MPTGNKVTRNNAVSTNTQAWKEWVGGVAGIMAKMNVTSLDINESLKPVVDENDNPIVFLAGEEIYSLDPETRQLLPTGRIAKSDYELKEVDTAWVVAQEFNDKSQLIYRLLIPTSVFDALQDDETMDVQLSYERKTSTKGNAYDYYTVTIGQAKRLAKWSVK